MTTITYTVAGTNTVADGSIASFDIVPNRSVEPVSIKPVTGYARAGAVIQRTTLELEKTVTIAQDAVPEAELVNWEQFYISQMYSNDTFEIDAQDIPTISAVLTCSLTPQNYAPSRFTCNHYTSGFTALVLDSLNYGYLLTADVTDTEMYGHNVGYGLNFDSGQVVFGFISTGADMSLSVLGFDIDHPTEVALKINDTTLGNMQTGTNYALSPTADVFAISSSLLNAGMNTMTVTQINPINVWGVTNLTLTYT